MVNDSPITKLTIYKHIILYKVRFIKFKIIFILTYEYLSFSDNKHPTKLKRAVANDCCLQMCNRTYLKTYYCGPEPEVYVSSASRLREMQYVNYTYYYWDLGKYLL